MAQGVPFKGTPREWGLFSNGGADRNGKGLPFILGDGKYSLRTMQYIYVCIYV